MSDQLRGEVEQLPVCAGSSHRWPADYSYGDTCMCGAFYLDTRIDGVVVVTEAPPPEPSRQRSLSHEVSRFTRGSRPCGAPTMKRDRTMFIPHLQRCEADDGRCSGRCSDYATGTVEHEGHTRYVCTFHLRHYTPTRKEKQR